MAATQQTLLAALGGVIDPNTGIQVHCKFPPTLAEVKDFCDAEQARIERLKEPPLAMRSVTRKPGPPPGQSYEELFAKHGRPFGPFEAGRQLPYNARAPQKINYRQPYADDDRELAGES